MCFGVHVLSFTSFRLCLSSVRADSFYSSEFFRTGSADDLRRKRRVGSSLTRQGCLAKATVCSSHPTTTRTFRIFQKNASFVPSADAHRPRRCPSAASATPRTLDRPPRTPPAVRAGTTGRGAPLALPLQGLRNDHHTSSGQSGHEGEAARRTSPNIPVFEHGFPPRPGLAHVEAAVHPRPETPLPWGGSSMFPPCPNKNFKLLEVRRQFSHGDD